MNVCKFLDDLHGIGEINCKYRVHTDRPPLVGKGLPNALKLLLVQSKRLADEEDKCRVFASIILQHVVKSLPNVRIPIRRTDDQDGSLPQRVSQ